MPPFDPVFEHSNPEGAKLGDPLDTHQSVYRERLLEHILVGELLKHSWLHAGATLEVSQPSIDRSGYDIVLEVDGVTRHVQFKSSSGMGKTSSQKVHIGLESKPSACVIWTKFDAQTMSLGPFYFFGGEPGHRLPSLTDFPTAKHTKGNALGIKLERPNFKVVGISRFRKLVDIASLYGALFGEVSLAKERRQLSTSRKQVGPVAATTVE